MLGNLSQNGTPVNNSNATQSPSSVKKLKNLKIIKEKTNQRIITLTERRGYDYQMWLPLTQMEKHSFSM